MKITKRLTNHEQSIVKYKEPPAERKKEIANLYMDNDVIHVYTDASGIPNNGIYGISAAFFSCGIRKVFDNKIYSKWVNQMSYAEMMAVAYGIKKIPEYLKLLDRYGYSPNNIVIYTDEKSIDTEDLKQLFRQEAKKVIDEERVRFGVNFPQFNLAIKHMDKDEKRYNPFHTAAHNASRRAIGKGK